MDKKITQHTKSTGYIGGGGSNNCVISGPFDTVLVANDELSDESFESTEESDACVDLMDSVGITKTNFQNLECIWAKRPGLPWVIYIV